MVCLRVMFYWPKNRGQANSTNQNLYDVPTETKLLLRHA